MLDIMTTLSLSVTADSADDMSIALACDDRADADAAAIGLAEVFDLRSFAKSIFADDEDGLICR